MVSALHARNKDEREHGLEPTKAQSPSQGRDRQAGRAAWGSVLMVTLPSVSKHGLNVLRVTQKLIQNLFVQREAGA